MDSIIYNHQSLIFCSLMVTYFQKCLIVIYIVQPVTLRAAYSCVLSSLSMIFLFIRMSNWRWGGMRL